MGPVLLYGFKPNSLEESKRFIFCGNQRNFQEQIAVKLGPKEWVKFDKYT